MDVCCNVVPSLQEALAHPHFAARGVFDHGLSAAGGARIDALPVPVAQQFRAAAGVAAYPPLGEGNGEFGFSGS